MTGRELIHSALRAVNAIGQEEVPEYGMFQSARETANLLLDSWSNEELMPHHYVRYDIPLFSGVTNYTIDEGDGYDSDSICLVQKPAASGSQALTINGTYATGGVATPDIPRHILIASSADDSDRTFTVIGTSEYDDAQTEVITGPATATVRGYQRFKTVTSVTIDDDSTGNLYVGTDYVIDVRRPVKVMQAFIRDSDGADTTLKVIDKNRYDEIADKDESGDPTKLYYDRSNPAGEVYVHPVPSTGVVISNNSGIECISNGGFASDTDWTIPGGSYWSITGGKLTRTAPSENNFLNNGSFDTTDAWEAFFGWTVAGDGKAAYGVSGTGGYIRQPAANMASPLQVLTDYTVTVTIGDSPTFTNNGVFVSLGSGVVDQGDPGTGSYINTAGVHTEVITTPSLITDIFTVTLPVDNTGIAGTSFNVLDVSVVPVAADDTCSQLAADLATSIATGTKYLVTFDMSDYSAGSVAIAVGNQSGPSVSWDGSLSQEIVCGADDAVEIDGTNAFTGKIDNLSVSDLPYSTLTPIVDRLYMDLWLPFVQLTEANIDDDISMPGEYLLALRWNLAAELAPEYGDSPSLYVLVRAEQTKDTIKMINGLIPKHANTGKPLPIIGTQIAVSQL